MIGDVLVFLDDVARRGVKSESIFKEITCVPECEIVTVVFIVRDYSVGVDGRSREVGLVAVGASADGEGIGVRVSRFKIFLWGVVIA